ncbi:MAG: hypothetical protein WDZ35_13380 [Crocinitomicaceae bacterium]
MKKIVFITACTFMIVLSSCKSGTCTCQVFGSEVSTDYNDMDRDDYKETKNDCENAGCDWSPKL